MKSITEFASFTLNHGLKTRAALSAEGKSPEEIQASLGETFKYEGDKLKHFVNALEIVSKGTENLKRVLVLSFAEGENTPPKVVKVEEHHYLPEFHIDPKALQAKKEAGAGKGDRNGRGGRGGNRGGGKNEKESPWGLSPEQKAAKKAKGGAGKTAPAPKAT
jgi:hypothetical protein